MRILRRYVSEVAAEHAAMHLRAQGVAARVYGRGTAFTRAAMGMPTPGVDLVLLVPEQAEAALTLLEEFESSTVELEEDWEAGAEPDVTRLDLSRLPITCPACDAPLTVDVNIVECGTCGTLTDAIERIVELHGPEALIEAELSEDDEQGTA